MIRMKRREGKRNKKGERGLKAREKKGSDGEPKGKGTRDGYITSRRTLCWESSGDFARFRNWNAPTRGRTGARKRQTNAAFPPPDPLSTVSSSCRESQVNGMSGYFGAVQRLLFFFICVYQALRLFPLSICLFLTFIRFRGAYASFFRALLFAACNSRILSHLFPSVFFSLSLIHHFPRLSREMFRLYLHARGLRSDCGVNLLNITRNLEYSPRVLDKWIWRLKF